MSLDWKNKTKNELYKYEEDDEYRGKIFITEVFRRDCDSSLSLYWLLKTDITVPEPQDRHCLTVVRQRLEKAEQEKDNEVHQDPWNQVWGVLSPHGLFTHFWIIQFIIYYL